MPHLHISLACGEGTFHITPDSVQAKLGLEVFTGPSSSGRCITTQLSLGAISALSVKAKQLLPCKLYLISLKNVCRWRRGRTMHRSRPGRGAVRKGKKIKQMGLVRAFWPFCCSLLIWIFLPTLGVINFSVDGQNTIISSKLFKWVVINFPFAGPCSLRVRCV